uniref:Spermatosis associated 3 n=1 Tax=Canis lupus dingo TaxID=286419 RepID=A0A8C0R671_CANLU
MRKGKRKKPESRRRGSTPQQASSEATPQQANSEATPQQASSEAIPLHTSSESTSSESTPQPPAPQAVPAPETNPLTRSLVPQDTNTKASSRSRKTGGKTSNSRTSGLPADGPPGSACWRRLGLCHSRIFDVLLPRAWPTMPGRGSPSLLTFYRKPTRKHSSHRNSRAPSSQDCCCGSGGPRSCVLHH